MGYYTDYELTVHPHIMTNQVLNAIIEFYAGYDPFIGTATWHECDTHVEQVSQAIPALIIIDGKGEEAGDIWRKAWLNGELVIDWKPEITPPEPSPELLQKVYAIEEDLRSKRIAELEAELKQLKGE